MIVVYFAGVFGEVSKLRRARSLTLAGILRAKYEKRDSNEFLFFASSDKMFSGYR